MMWTALEDCRPRGLRSYGVMPEQQAEQLDDLVDTLLHVLEGTPGQSADSAASQL